MPAGYLLANASPFWTQCLVGTKYGEFTSFQIWLLLPTNKRYKIDRSWNQTQTGTVKCSWTTTGGPDIWWWPPQVKSHIWASYLHSLRKTLSRRLLEHSKASRDQGMALFLLNVVERHKQQIWVRLKLPSIRCWIHLVESSDVETVSYTHLRAHET